MISGHATLDELRNASAGTVFRERRLLDIGGLRLDGAPVRADYRATMTIAQIQARIDTLTLQARIDALLNPGLPR